jgi:hypothetical protein
MQNITFFGSEQNDCYFIYIYLFFIYCIVQYVETPL